VDEYVFHPPRRAGIAVHLGLIVLLSTAGFLGLLQATRARVGPTLLIYMLPALVAVFVIPMLIYRLSALSGASYSIERDGMRLRWGLRAEDIPMDAVQWVGKAEHYKNRLPKPLLYLPGAVLGLRQQPGSVPVEYMAALTSSLILITTPRCVFAISPENEEAFLNAFRRASELGSITPLSARSAYPGLVLALSWTERLPRTMLLTGLALSLMLIMWAAMVIPGREQLSLRVWPGASAPDTVPAVRILLLPVLNFFFYIIDAILGLFFYRRRESRPAAYLIWGSSILTSLLFMGAVYFISRAE
jgi:hypothetical protein